MSETIIARKRGRRARVVNFKKNKDINIMDKTCSFENKLCILKLPMTLDRLHTLSPVTLGIENILLEIPKNYIGEDNIIPKTVAPTNIDTVKKKVYNVSKDSGSVTIYEKNILPVEISEDNIERIKCIKVDLECWWCCHSFDTYPLSAPCYYDSVKKIFKVIGCFCSFNCVKAYIVKDTRYDPGLVLLMRKMLIKDCLIKNIKVAPSRYILKKFGGPISIGEYRSSFDSLTDYTVNVFPMIYLPSQVEERKVNKLLKESIHKLSTKDSKTLSERQISGAIKRLSQTNKSRHDKSKNNNSLTRMLGIKVLDNS